jgi:hypothetical protein
LASRNVPAWPHIAVCTGEAPCRYFSRLLGLSTVQGPAPEREVAAKPLLERSLATLHVVLSQAAVGSALEPDAMLVHLNNLDQVWVLAKALVKSASRLRGRVRTRAMGWAPCTPDLGGRSTRRGR